MTTNFQVPVQAHHGHAHVQFPRFDSGLLQREDPSYHPAIAQQTIPGTAPKSSLKTYENDLITRIPTFHNGPRNGGTSKLKITEWHVRLYKNGAPTTSNNHWGLITGKSSQEVMTKLKNAQEFELKYNAWAGKGRVRDEVLTNFNPFGPIAVVDDQKETDPKKSAPPSISPETWQKITGIYEEVKGYYDGYQTIMEIVTGKESTPFDNVGAVFREYSDNLKEAFLRVNALRHMLLKNTTTSMDKINADIRDINNRIQIVSK